MNIPAVLDTRQSVVPREEGSKKAEKAGSLLKRIPRRFILQVVRVAFASKQEEAYVCGKEQEEMSDAGPERADQEEGGEDPPGGQEETHDGAGISFIGTVCSEGVPSWRQEHTVGDPEAAIGGKSGGTKCIPNSHFPRKMR